MKPFVSVCIPTYNGARYIRECIESALGQSYDNMEILVVDDQSKDATRSIVEEYARGDSRIRLFVNEINLGLVPNWNRCVDLARGEWVKFVLQDDFIELDCIDKMMNVPAASGPLRVCERRFLFDQVDDDTEKLYDSYRTRWSLSKIFLGLTEISAKSLCEAVRKYGTINFIGEPAAVLINREMFRRFGGFNPNFVQLCDLEYWIRVGGHTGLTYIPETLATFRVHRGSMSSKGQSGAYFRTRVIDPLLLMHEFAYSPFFRPVRTGRLGFNALRIHQRLAQAAYDVRNSVARAAADPSLSDGNLINEWNNAVKLYPLLDQSLCLHLIRFREYLNKYLWRFRRAASQNRIRSYDRD